MTEEPVWYEPYLNQAEQQNLRRRFMSRYKGLFSDAEAEDAFQQVISVMFTQKVLKPVKHRENLSAYFNTLYRGTCIDQVRSVLGRSDYIPKKLRDKGDAHKELFLLHCSGGLPAEQISEQVKLPIRCVKKCIAWIDRKNRCAGRPEVSDIDPDDILRPEDIQNDLTDVERELEQMEKRALVQQLLSGESKVKLKPDQGLVLKLRFMEEMSIKETADSVRLTERQVKYLQKSALELLKKHLRNYPLDPL